MKYGRVLFVNRFYYPDESATSQMLTDLACRLVRGGCEVHVLASRQRIDDPKAALDGSALQGGVVIHRVSSSTFGRRWLPGRAIDYLSFYLAAGWRLVRLLRRDDAVVAMTDPPLISIVAWLAVSLRGATLINWLQDVFPEVATALDANPLPARMDAPLRALRNGSLRAARVNVALGGRMRDHLLRLPLPAERICVIENWADGTVVVPKPACSSRLRRDLGRGAEFVIGYSGNFGRAHEFGTLVAAAELLRAESGIVFLMIGSGARLGELRAAVARSGLDSFRFLPPRPREELGDSLAAADVHLVTLQPRLEGLIVPSKFYGILAAGRPTLFVGDVDGEVARALRAHDCGCAVPIGAAPALAAMIGQLRADRSACEAMGARGRALFDARYTASRAVKQWRSLLGAEA